MRKLPIIAMAVTLLVGALIAVTSHRGGRAYFSPHTLEYRVQSERTIYATGVPIYRSAYRSVDHPLIEMLVTEGFVSPQAGDADRWEVIFHWNDSWRDGYGPLYDLFRRRNEVIEWSRAHPEVAQIYWAEGFRYLRSRDERDILLPGDSRTLLGNRECRRTAAAD
jgi:hypothetical protein